MLNHEKLLHWFSGFYLHPPAKVGGDALFQAVAASMKIGGHASFQTVMVLAKAVGNTRSQTVNMPGYQKDCSNMKQLMPALREYTQTGAIRNYFNSSGTAIPFSPAMETSFSATLSLT